MSDDLTVEFTLHADVAQPGVTSVRLTLVPSESKPCFALPLAATTWALDARVRGSPPASVSIGVSVVAGGDAARLGLTRIILARTASTLPSVTISTAVGDYFSTADAPGPISNTAYAQDKPIKFLIFERACVDDMASVPDAARLWDELTSVQLRDLIHDSKGMAGLAADTTFQDVTERFRAHPYPSWSTLRADYHPGATSISFSGAECGPGARRLVLLQMHASRMQLTNPLQAQLLFQSGSFINPVPSIWLSLVNDPTRVYENGLVVLDMPDLSVFPGDAARMDADGVTFSYDIAVPLGAATQRRVMWIMLIGDPLPPLDAGPDHYRFSAAQLAGRCSTLPADFEVTPTEAAMFDAVLTNSAWPTLVAGQTTLGASLLYP
ncbi:MAG: hypothetical protein WCN81_17270, partial [Actinomycetes bacterium]